MKKNWCLIILSAGWNYVHTFYYMIWSLVIVWLFSPTKITLIGAVLFALQQTHYLPLHKHHLMLIYTIFIVVNKVSIRHGLYFSMPRRIYNQVIDVLSREACSICFRQLKHTTNEQMFWAQTPSLSFTSRLLNDLSHCFFEVFAAVTHI